VILLQQLGGDLAVVSFATSVFRQVNGKGGILRDAAPLLVGAVKLAATACTSSSSAEDDGGSSSAARPPRRRASSSSPSRPTTRTTSPSQRRRTKPRRRSPSSRPWEARAPSSRATKSSSLDLARGARRHASPRSSRRPRRQLLLRRGLSVALPALLRSVGASLTMALFGLVTTYVFVARYVPETKGGNPAPPRRHAPHRRSPAGERRRQRLQRRRRPPLRAAPLRRTSDPPPRRVGSPRGRRLDLRHDTHQMGSLTLYYFVSRHFLLSNQRTKRNERTGTNEGRGIHSFVGQSVQVGR